MTKLPPKRASAASSVEDDLAGFMASKGIDDQADYIARGRCHKDLSAQELTEKWVQAFKRMAEDPWNYDSRAIHSDLLLEFHVRREEPPYELVREESERLRAAAEAVIEELRRDPEKFEEIGRGIEVDINIFKSARDKTNS